MRKPERPRRRAFLPLAECLESRIALSAEVGVSLNYNSVYNGDPIWTDLHNLAYGSWVANAPNTTVPLTADGYPLVDATIYFQLANYPSGNYGFSYTGAGTVTFSSVGQLAAPPTVSNGVTTGTIVVDNQPGASTILTMTVTNVNPSAPMDNLHIMMPGYGNGTTPEPMFTTAFLRALAPFSDIRFMNWDEAIDSTVSNWSDRVPPTALITDGSAGVPYEDMIELCNESHKDMWINIPTEATSAFVQDLAQLIDAELDPNLNVYAEYSNETWNNASPVFGEVLGAAEANPLVTQSGNQSMMVAQQSAYEMVSIAQVFDQVFGAQASRVRPIMAAQAAWSQIASWQLQFIQQNYGPPSQFIYASAVAPYVGIPGGDNVAGLTIDQVFAEANQYMTNNIVPWLQSDAAVAADYGVPLVSYEGGPGLAPGANDLNFGVLQAASNDPRMYQLDLTLMAEWERVGGGLFNAYTLDGVDSQYGFWGLLPNVLSTGSQKYDALLSMILPPGDADLDGMVTYADFQTLAANYGTKGDYWEQGDFNDDGVVNWQDLNLLRQNLDPAGFTVGQFAQQALFGDLGTVDSPTALEYDGYGVTYASSLPFTASAGTVKLNLNSQGQAIVLGGADYSEGLGVLANSSVTLALDGQYARYESTIGVDGSSNTGSSVIFDVYGDGQLLYQSPALTYASGAIPIDVNVSGVTNLTLTVSPAPGSIPSTDHAVWADARLVSSANFGSTQPYTLTWQLSQNGTVLSTQTTDSFVLDAISGTYTLTLTVTDAQGDTATASTSVSENPVMATASSVRLNPNTEGNWIGTYGAQGYDIINGPVSLPSYATVTPSGALSYTWPASTTDPRALQAPSGTYGIAACWYAATSFTVDVDLTDGQVHDLELYFVDLNGGRSERVQIRSATTGAVLDTETVSSFTSGVYLQWALSGNVLITITRVTGVNAILSGLFFDPIRIVPPPSLTSTTEGSWIGTYGAQGYDIIGGPASLPNYVTVTPSGALSYTWPASTTDPRALQVPGGTGGIAACWYAATSFTVDVDLTDGQVHDLELYFVDLNGGRSERVQIRSVTTGAVLDTETVSSFTSGVYLQWAVSGNILITITRMAGANAVLSGLFFDSPPVTIAAIDTTTKGNWIGTYGAQGYDVINGPISLPSYATVTPSGALSYTWPASTTDPRALQVPGGTYGIAACWYAATSFTVDVDLTDGQVHDLELYFVDLNGGRSEWVQISSATTGAVLDTATVSSFTSGIYLQWAVSGNTVITITRLVGVNAILSGLFFDPNSNSTVAVVQQGSTAPVVQQGSTTEGNLIGAYGMQSYDIGDVAQLPSYAAIAASGVSPYAWAVGTADSLVLQDARATGTPRIRQSL